LYTLDILLSFASIYFAFFLRWDWDIPGDQYEIFIALLPFVLFCRSLSYFYFGFYSRFWEYSSIEDLVQIIKSVVFGSFLILFSTFIYNRAWMVPRSIIVIDLILLVMSLGGTRMLWRILREELRQFSQPKIEHHIDALIFGAGDTGAHLLKHLKQFFPNYSVIGFIDDDLKMRKTNLMGVQVLGAGSDIPRIAKEYEVKELLIAEQDISSEKLAELIDICTKNGIKYKITTSVIDLSTNKISISKIKNIEITDLLERDMVSLDLSSISMMLKGKRVLVTGAGGSIGSQLCKHILEHSPASLIMVDIGENYLFDLKMDLGSQGKDTKTKYVFGSVTNESKMESVFAEFRPQLVFHAAAHKHVPLMEENVDVAITNNVYGTKLTADLSEKYGTEKFVLVSTDKVVRPKSIMGMTKKLSEDYIQFLSGESKTQFMIVRFGNVLGSNGSVVILFEKQIANGGPVTVTHPEMERFFMVIPEAVQLILQAGAIGAGSDVFLLDMGKPVKITDLANKMIRLSGYEPGADIEIKFTGIRPGEKLAEELINSGEKAIPTKHKKIQLLRSENTPGKDFGMRIETLCLNAPKVDPVELKGMLQELVSINSSKQNQVNVCR